MDTPKLNFGGFVADAAAIPAGVQNVMAPPYNCYGDGVHDDTAAITAAMRNGIAYLPPGKFCCNLIMGDKQRLVGAGIKRSILLPADQTKPVITVGDGVTETRHVDISYLSIGDGNVINTPAGLLVNGVYWLNLVQVDFDSCSGDNILVTAGTHPTSFVWFRCCVSRWARGSCLKVVGSGLPVGSYVTAVYFHESNIIGGNYTDETWAVYLDSVELNCTDVYVDCYGDHGVYLKTANTKLLGSDLVLDSDSSADNLVTLGVAIPSNTLTSVLKGHISIDGNVTTADGSVIPVNDAGLGTYDRFAQGRFSWPYIHGRLLFKDNLDNTPGANAVKSDLSLYRSGNHLFFTAPVGGFLMLLNSPKVSSGYPSYFLEDTDGGGLVEWTVSQGNAYMNVPAGKWFKFSSPVYIAGTAAGVFAGAGSPEGVVAAAVGSLFLRTDGGAGTTLYVKQSGGGNTGWVAK